MEIDDVDVEGKIAAADNSKRLFRNTSQKQASVNSSDGTPIFYEVSGRGDIALIFIHGMSCNQTFWSDQVSYFDEKFKVVTLDLAGHGLSESTREDWSIEAFSEDVGAVVKSLELERGVLVGHSLGGLVALESAKLLNQRVKGVVVVDEVEDIYGTYPKFEVVAGKILATINYPFFIDRLARSTMFSENPSNDVVNSVVSTMKLTPSKIGGLMVSGYFEYFNGKKLGVIRELDVPVVLLNFPEETKVLEQVEDGFRHVQTYQLPEVGHFGMIEFPVQFNSKLEEALEAIE